MGRLWLVVVVMLVLFSGCGADVSRSEAAAAAVAFAGATPQEQCRQLAPRTRERLERRSKESCEKAMAEIRQSTDSTLESVEIAGQSAQVRLGTRAIFLARFPTGWLVTAAGCVRTDADTEVPYECEVEP